MKNRFFALLPGLFLAAGVQAQTLSNSSPGVHGSELLRLGMGLIVVVAIILLLSWCLKRLNGLKIAGTSGMKIITSMSLGAREKLVLVNAGERILLLGVTTGSINMLHDFGEKLPPGFNTESSQSFSRFLKIALAKD